MDYDAQQNIDEGRMHPDYRTEEEGFRKRAMSFIDAERELRERIRSDVDATPDERQEAYMGGYEKIEAGFSRAADDFGSRIGKTISESREKVFTGRGEGFSGHLIQASSMPKEKLPELMAVARRTGQQDLQQAVAMVAHERHMFPLFNEWAASEPERAEALRRLRGTPGSEQFYARTTLAMKPPRADSQGLEPTQADRDQAEDLARRKAAPRQQFFNLPRRQIGRRTL